MTILVTGATGRTPSGVVRHLRATGADVRVLVRDLGKAEKTFSDLDGVEIVAGAFDDADVQATAFDGVDTVFLAIGSSPDQVRLEKALIDGAAQAKVQHIVKLGSIGAGHDSALMVGRLHAEIEDHLVASGIAHTLLHPASFSANLLYAAGPVAATGSWEGAAPTGRVAYIDYRDLSEAAALVLSDPALQGRVHHWNGPDAFTFPEVAQLLSRLLGREISYVPRTVEERTAALTAAGLPEFVVTLLVGLDIGNESGQAAALTTELQEVLGRDPRSVEEFLVENIAAFTSA